MFCLIGGVKTSDPTLGYEEWLLHLISRNQIRFKIHQQWHILLLPQSFKKFTANYYQELGVQARIFYAFWQIYKVPNYTEQTGTQSATQRPE